MRTLRIVVLVGLMGSLAGFAAAQTSTSAAGSSTAPTSATSTTSTASTSNGFSASGGAIALHYAGAWSAASVERESFDFLDFGATKANHLYVQGLELEMPTPGVDAYLGGVTIQPNIAGLFKKTNLPAGSLGVFFDGNIGNGLPTSGGSHVTWLAGGGVLYNFTVALAWQPLMVQYGRFGTNSFVAMSTQLQFAFGK